MMFVLFVFGQNCYGQATAGQQNPYRNLGKYHIYNNDWTYPGTLPPEYSWSNEDDWFGTQSTPTSYEKAIWALDDINAYRAEEGLSAFPESILEAKPFQKKACMLGQIASVICLLIFSAILIYCLFELKRLNQNRK
jgi:hypothetical protein